jgi:hypothetical protein
LAAGPQRLQQLPGELARARQQHLVLPGAALYAREQRLGLVASAR